MSVVSSTSSSRWSRGDLDDPPQERFRDPLLRGVRQPGELAGEPGSAAEFWAPEPHFPRLTTGSVQVSSKTGQLHSPPGRRWIGLEAPTGSCCSLLEEHEPADGLRCPTNWLGARRLLERPADAVVRGIGRDECSSSRAALLAQTRASSGRRGTFRPRRCTAALPAKREPRATECAAVSVVAALAQTQHAALPLPECRGMQSEPTASARRRGSLLRGAA